MHFALARRRRRRHTPPLFTKGLESTSGGRTPKSTNGENPTQPAKRPKSILSHSSTEAVGITHQTVGELLDEWVDRRSGIAPATKKRYKEMIVQIKTGLGRIALISSPPDIERHLDERLKRQQAGTVLMQFRLIRQTIRQAVRQGRMLTNWSDVNLEQDTLVVRRTISRIGSKLLFNPDPA